MVDIPFAEWLPDQMSLESPGGDKAMNVIPVTQRTYGPINDLSESFNALGTACLGAGSFRGETNGAVLNVAGTATKLYNLDSSSWTDHSKGGGYAVAAGDRWCFTQFGDDVIASNGTDNLQFFTIGTSTDWADLAGSPPVGRFVTETELRLVTPLSKMSLAPAVEPRRKRNVVSLLGFQVNVTLAPVSVLPGAGVSRLGLGGSMNV